MSQTAMVSELKARVGGYLAHVRRGGIVTVYDRKTPIARLVPLGEIADGIRVREAVAPEGLPGRKRVGLK